MSKQKKNRANALGAGAGRRRAGAGDNDKDDRRFQAGIRLLQARRGYPKHKRLMKLSTEAANQLGADVVVVHPPFRWQRSYATRFVEGVRELAAGSGVTIAVENMYPWRAPGGGDLQAHRPSRGPPAPDHAAGENPFYS